MDHDVAGKTWVATALPRATDVTISFKNLDVGVTRVTELVGGDDAARACADYKNAAVFSDH